MPCHSCDKKPQWYIYIYIYTKVVRLKDLNPPIKYMSVIENNLSHAQKQNLAQKHEKENITMIKKYFQSDVNVRKCLKVYLKVFFGTDVGF